MSGCRFGSPDLVTSLSGTAASPTFAFSAANANYLGLAGSFTSPNGAVCSFPTRSVGAGKTSAYAITPIIVTTSGFTGKTTTCSILAPASIVPTGTASTTYAGIECPSIIDNQFAPGTYTLRFSQPVLAGVPTISSRLFIVASPTFVTDSTTQTVWQTATASVAPGSTATVTQYTSTATTTTRGSTTTATVSGGTTTVTSTATTCPSSSSAAPSSSAPSSSDTPSSSSVPPSSSSVPPSSSSVPPSSSSVPPSSSSDPPASSSAPPSSSSDLPSSSLAAPSSSSAAPSSSDPPASSSASSSSAPSPTATQPVSQNGECGAASGQTCLGSVFGNCCSMYGYCGSGDIYCQTTQGCQSAYGNCVTPSPVSSSAQPTSTVRVSPDGSCGGTNGYVCTGSTFGDCCSPYGWCGSTTDHCGAGCQTPFGTCSSSTATGTAPLPSSTLKVSLDGTCGGTTGQTCQGSNFGNCCSEYGYCGATTVYCSTGCQPDFGTCSAAVKRSMAKLKPRAFGSSGSYGRVKKAVGGAGPDYTYPPVPHTTVTAGVTSTTTFTPSAGIATTTVLAVSTVTVDGGVVTVTQTGAATTSTETTTVTAC